MKIFLSKIIPPFLRQIIRLYSGSWQGNYKKWEDAAAKADGYDSPEILHKVRDSLLKVKEGHALFERDSVLFYEEDYNFPLLTSFLYIANLEDSNLHVLDFGGSLGSTYFQNKKILNDIKHVTWSVVEQVDFVDCGKEHFEDAVLNFFKEVDHCLLQREKQTLLLSSVIQYIPDHVGLIKKLLNYNFKYIIIDRTPFFDQKKDRITVQTVPRSIYKASYPCRIFNKSQFLSQFLGKYEIIFPFKSKDECNLDAVFEGFLLKRKEI